jgi:hypothetical protein
MRCTSWPIALSWLAVACSSNSSGALGRDAAIDAPAIDAPPDAGGPDADAGPCGLYFYQQSAVFLDWDSTAAAPCAITGSRWYVHLDPRYETTDASGKLAICLASNNPELDIHPPTGSTCTTPPSTYSIPGLVIATRSVADAGGVLVARSLDDARIGPFYAGFGSAFDAAKGQLFVHLTGAPRAIAIGAPHAAAQAWGGTAWASGDTGGDVFFPNIDLGAGTTTDVSVAGGGALGTGSVPLVAGTITYMAIVVN